MYSNATRLKLALIIMLEIGPVDRIKDKLYFNGLTMLSFEIV